LAVETWGLTKVFKGPPPTDQHAWTDAVVEGVKRLVRPHPPKTVLDRVTLSVRRGECFGIIGANGAGKTTFLKVLNCLLYPDAGGGRVNGHDLLRDRSGVRRSTTIALAAGYLGLLWQLTARENLLFRARMCGLSHADANAAVDYVLERLEVRHKQHEHSWNWSAGERQKFSLALAFIGGTPLVMLDEPTSHLDPRTARLIREFVRADLNRRNGQTILMCTHYLEEADQLCDRVAVFHEGKVLACDSPARLKRRYAPGQILELVVTGYAPEIGARVAGACGLAALLAHFEDVATGRARLRPQWTRQNGPSAAAGPDATGAGEAVGGVPSSELRVPGSPSSDSDRGTPNSELAALTRALEASGVGVAAVHPVAPTMDDVYFALVRDGLK
jgi:ABC-2 type transport system ATP-binding protein